MAEPYWDRGGKSYGLYSTEYGGLDEHLF